MKPRLLIIAVFLLLGAVVNVVVAWGFAAWLSVIPSKSSVRFIHPIGSSRWPLPGRGINNPASLAVTD